MEETTEFPWTYEATKGAFDRRTELIILDPVKQNLIS